MSKRFSALSIFLLILIGASSKELNSQTGDRALKLGEQVKTLPGTPKRYALVIGVDQYADTQITTLGGASNDAKTLASSSLAGTTWTGSRPETGEYTIKFLKDGQLEYIINVMQNGVTAPRTVKGSWKQAGNDVQIVIGNSYSVLQGTLEGSLMKGTATNQEGVSWKWTLFKKE